MIKVEWKGGRAFEAMPPSGNPFTMDAYPESGGQDLGPTPLEAFVSGAAACSGIDVLMILEKKRQKVTSYRVEVDGERPAEGVYPRPYTTLIFRHILEGENLNEAAVQQAITLSDQKYCSAIATLRFAPGIESIYEIRNAEALAGAS